MPDHYAVLGVPSDADAARVRAAYRDLARRLHPDRQGAASAGQRSARAARMGQVNEAWRVLGDPVRRAAYDADRRSAGAAAAHATGPGPIAPRRIPDDDGGEALTGAGLVAHGSRLWWVVVLAALGAIFIITAYAGGDDGSGPERPAAEANVGRCVTVRPGPATSVVGCGEPGALRIVGRVGPGEPCPRGAEPRRLAPDGRFECVRPAG